MFGRGAFARPGACGQMLGGVKKLWREAGTIPVIVGEGFLTYGYGSIPITVIPFLVG